MKLVQEIARFLGIFGVNTASDISKFTKISRAAAAASDFWEVLKYHELVFIPNYAEETVLFLVYTTRQRNFALYVTGVIFTGKYFRFGLNIIVGRICADFFQNCSLLVKSTKFSVTIELFIPLNI